MSEEMLARIDERLKSLAERYHTDREETTRRYEAEREERKQWRDEVQGKIDGLEKQIAPVVKDHQFIVMGGKWITTAAVSTWGLFKGWIFLKDHLH